LAWLIALSVFQGGHETILWFTNPTTIRSFFLEDPCARGPKISGERKTLRKTKSTACYPAILWAKILPMLDYYLKNNILKKPVTLVNFL